MMTMVIILLAGWSIKEMRAISPWWRKLYELKAAGADALLASQYRFPIDWTGFWTMEEIAHWPLTGNVNAPFHG